MRTAVFDIDGTLTDTNAVDHECYVSAVLDVAGLRVGDEWGGVDDVTDSNILRALWVRERSGPLPPSVERDVIARFVELLEREADERPDRFRPIGGATDVFARVTELGWRPAMATGGWRPSARLKLARAGIPFESVPLASASEHALRADIIRHALGAPVGESPEAVYFGDRPWDLRAAHALGMPFIGVGGGEAATRLREAGAPVVLPDLADADALAETLRRPAPLNRARVTPTWARRPPCRGSSRRGPTRRRARSSRRRRQGAEPARRSARLPG